MRCHPLLARGSVLISAKAVFDRVISMSPAFYENLMTGERCSADHDDRR